MFDVDIKKLRFENNLSQEELGKILNVTKQQISKIETGKAKLSEKNYLILQKYFKNIKRNDDSDNFLEIDYYDDINTIKSCFDVLKAKKIMLPTKLFAKKENSAYFICHQIGNSMEPLIYDRDFLVIERKINKNLVDEIEDGRIYLFSYKDKIYLKELSVNINQIVVKSLNSDFPIQYIENIGFKEISLIGKLICHGRFCSF